MPVSPDPRVKHGDGPHPNIASVTALCADVHVRLDALGVPREVEAGVLTILGRLDALLERTAPVDVEVAGVVQRTVMLKLGGHVHNVEVGDTLRVPAVVLS